MQPTTDHAFEISLCEGILRHDGDHLPAMQVLSGLYSRAGRTLDGLEMDRELVRREEHNPIHHYNLACSLALNGQTAEAIQALNRARQLGYHDLGHLQQDDDLKILHALPAFQALLQAWLKHPD